MKEFINKIGTFFIRRIAEGTGLIIIFFSIFLLISLFSYSPEDPNFIFEENKPVKNLMGLNGSIASDLMFQSFGLISILIPFTLFFTGLNILLSKKFLSILENSFFAILYIIIGCLFFSSFYEKSYWLIINGNDGFIANLYDNTALSALIIRFKNFSYYFLILLVMFLFLKSINFKIYYIIYLFKKIINNLKLLSKKNNIVENTSNEVPIENEYRPEIDKTLTQENFQFEKKVIPEKNSIKFKLPSLDFLKQPSKKERENLIENKINEETLEKILLDFGVEGKIKKISNGPVVTLNEFEPAPGIKVSKIINLSEDIARNTSSESARIATVPGSSSVGIELPKSSRENVYLSEILSSTEFSKKNIKLPIALGKSISGLPITGDLTSMPHLLIAGTTGSGKSVCINTIILSILYRHPPDKCKFILIDPKMLELSTYEGIPHLLCPVITEAKKAASVLGWVVKEMENRYKLMTKVGVRNIDGYNEKHKMKMPYIVVIVDEMSDLMLVAGKEIENYIQKLSQMARAAGIHIIMATQRPSVDVITGTIKAK